MDQRYIQKSGSIVWVNLHATLVRDHSGEPAYFIAALGDIPERRQAQEEIARMNASLATRAKDLENADRELEAFNYTLAHNLRGPLNSMACTSG